MGAAGSIGRVGGLAVTLGVGAAVMSGAGAAWADPSAQSGSDSTSTSTSTSTTDSTAKTGTAAAEPSSSTTSPATSSSTPGVTVSTGALSSGSKTALPEPFSPSTLPKPGKRSTTPPLTRATTTIDQAPNKPALTPPVATAFAAPATAKLDTARLALASPTTALSSPTATATNLSAPVDAQPQPAVSTTAPAQDPMSLVTFAISSLVDSLASPFADNTPTGPVDTPATWTMLAAARRETFATTPSLAAAADPVTTPLAIPQTAPLAWLQQVPVLGPVLVTPIVAVIHQIPVIGDILHPFIGFPVQMGLPVGAPLPRDVKVISFDGTPIYVHFMPAAGLQAGVRAPTILDGPGLGQPGATNLDGTLLDPVLDDALGTVSIATLRAAGYNVVTWDPRGEWNSGGLLEIDSPDFEARDVSAIISWLATQPEVQLDGDPADLDPRIGMVGVSYGGGIQLVTAATDHRVDAIVPTIAWHSLTTSLYKSEAFKSGWGTILGAALLLTLARPNPLIYPGLIYGDLTGTLPPIAVDLLAQRGPGSLVSQITAPTLLIQGTVDSLFTLQEADDNAKALIAAGVPTKVLWFCGGHGVCVNDLFDLTDGALIEQRTLEWLNRYVKGDTTVSTGPQFEFVDQHGQYFSSNVYPAAAGTPIVASNSAGGLLPLLPFLGGSGPLIGVLPIGGTPAFNALNLTVPAASTTTYIVGAPTLTLTYSGTGVSRHVFAQLVDNSTGLVLGNQVTPVPVTLDGQTHTITVPLEPVAHTLAPGETVTLQLVASAASYETIWSLGELTVSSMQLTLPTADAAALTPESVV